MLVTIDESVIDGYGHMNYKAYPRLFEQGQDAFMDSRDIGFRAIEERFGLRSVVADMHVAYHGELHAGDEVNLVTTVTVGRTSITYIQLVKRGDEILANMQLVVVLKNGEGKPTPVPDKVRAKIG
ncbi:MAG: thioesterase family protein [Patescibacteria group bacterium]